MSYLPGVAIPVFIDLPDTYTMYYIKTDGTVSVRCPIVYNSFAKDHVYIQFGDSFTSFEMTTDSIGRKVYVNSSGETVEIPQILYQFMNRGPLFPAFEEVFSDDATEAVHGVDNTSDATPVDTSDATPVDTSDATS